MDIVFHIGAHNTDDDLLVTSLMRDAEALAKRGVLVPEPAKYRAVLRDALVALKGKPASEEIQDAILDTILEDSEGTRVVFSFEHFICTPQAVFEGGVFYGKMAQKASWLRNLFPDFPVTFQIGLRDPATLVPVLYDRLPSPPPFAEWLARIDPTSLSWVKVIDSLREGVPDAPVTLWCNEDTPLIWPEVLRGLAGVPQDMALGGDEALLETIMTGAGMTRMRAYLETHPPRTATQRRRVVAAFLDKFALPEAMDESFERPGWGAQVMDVLTARYEADLGVLQGRAGVTALVP